MDEKLSFGCATCAWFQEVVIPEGEKKPEGWTPRGNCYANPPAVFPVPRQQQSKLALAQGQQAPGQVTMVPLMMRPIVDKSDNPCGKYQPNSAMRDQLAELQPGGCGGCQDEGAKCACEE